MSEPLNPSSSRTHILDKVRRNEVVVNRKDIMVEVLKSKPTKHNWAASLKREVGGDIVIWMITPRAGFDVEACWIGDTGKMRKQTIRTGRTKPLRSGSRLTLFRSGSGPRSMLTRTVTFHSSTSGGAELRQQCCPSTDGFRGDMNCGATSMKGQGPRAKRTACSSAAKATISETRRRSEANRMVVTPTRTRWADGSRTTPGGVSGNRKSSPSSAASKTPLLPESGEESHGKPEQHPEPVPLSESPQMVPLGSNGVPTSTTTGDRIQGMGEMRPLDDRGKRKGKGEASSPGEAEAVAAAFPEAKSEGGDGMNSDEETEWICGKCSLINKALFLQCDVCLAERPTKRSFLEEETWGGHRRVKKHRMTKTRGSESGGTATPPSSGTAARSETPDGVHRSGGKRLEVSSDGVRGSSLSSSPSLGEAGFWNTPLDSPPRADESGSRRDAVRETKRRDFDEPTVAETGNGMEGLGVKGFPCAMASKGKGEEGGRDRQCVSDVEEGETELVEGTEGEAFSAAFINPTSVSGALEYPPRPNSLESAPPLLSSTSGESDSSAQSLQNYPATDSGLVLEDTGNGEVGTTVVQSQGDKGKEKRGEEEEEEEAEDDMELDESVVDDSEQEEAEYDSSVSLDY